MQSREEERREAQSCLMAGKVPDSLTIREAMDDEHGLQREHAAKFGCCSMGCDENQLIRAHTGIVCNWTRRPCPRIALGKLIEDYSKLNRDCLPLLFLFESSKC